VALEFERIRALLEKLENPHEELKTVQVLGTNGKGTNAGRLRSGVRKDPHRQQIRVRTCNGTGGFASSFAID
jgi:folylpolyglutamate synthase/dihydropteroate synthase